LAGLWVMMNEKTEQQDLERQLQAATAAREVVLSLLCAEVRPEVIVMVAWVTGVTDSWAEVMHQAGLVHHATLQAGKLPVAGNA
jgi:hypothetical protein